MRWLKNMATVRFPKMSESGITQLVRYAEERYPPAGGWSNATLEQVIAALDKGAVDVIVETPDEHLDTLEQILAQ